MIALALLNGASRSGNSNNGSYEGAMAEAAYERAIIIAPNGVTNESPYAAKSNVSKDYSYMIII